MKQIRLAPAYDIVSTVIYKQRTRDMAFHIGGALSMDDISRDAFRSAAGEAGLGERMAVRRFDDMAKRFRTALHESAEELVRAGYLKAAEIEVGISQTAGIKNIKQ